MKKINQWEMLRIKVWAKAWCSSCQSYNAESKTGAKFADRCLNDFDERFKEYDLYEEDS